jgi:hypothetical protein
MTNEAPSRVNIDAQLKNDGWDAQNPNAVGYEYPLADGRSAGRVLDNCNVGHSTAWRWDSASMVCSERSVTIHIRVDAE